MSDHIVIEDERRKRDERGAWKTEIWYQCVRRGHEDAVIRQSVERAPMEQLAKLLDEGMSLRDAEGRVRAQREKDAAGAKREREAAAAAASSSKKGEQQKSGEQKSA